MANLAIRGIRGNVNNLGWKVIKTLEMLGGINKFELEGNTDQWYVLGENRLIRYCGILFEEKGFTLEEFLEKFPYKIGDRVRVPEYESEVCISKMYWDGNEVQYEVVTDEVEWYSAEELNEFNEPHKEAPIYLNEKANKRAKEIIKIDIPKGYEFAGVDDNQQVVFEKIGYQYPKTFIEVLSFWHPDRQLEDDYQRCYKKDLIEKFQDLLYARAAYWKIAGEQMGLGKPWEPDWTNLDQLKYCIWVDVGEFVTMTNVRGQHILAFPTAEMRDAFYENFKDLIEQCKELL